VDDEALIAMTLAMILRQSGFSVSSFTDPLEALDQAKSAAPDLLITDVMMPHMSGVELAIQIREMCPSCKILLFSGQAATADLLVEAREKGYDFDLLLKPIHPKDFLLSVRRLAATAEFETSPNKPELLSR
jgi:CheY-like chemotaxis protein